MWEAIGAVKGGFGAGEQRRTGAHKKTIWSFPLFSLYKTEWIAHVVAVVCVGYVECSSLYNGSYNLNCSSVYNG
jgi:hypothetical protein